jgi:hypothetical protein
MDRKAYACKHCNMAFTKREQLEIHQKAHFEKEPILQIELPAMHQQPPPMMHQLQQQLQPILFYNQPVQQPMNFYTENISFNTQLIQPKKEEFPIMNQLLSNKSLIQPVIPPVKNFVCGICNNAFFKKKELDRHVMTIHTNAKQFKCESCPKMFNRKDKLLRHEKTHSYTQTIFNCSLCPAVFVRKEMLDQHSVIHEKPNGDQKSEHLRKFLESLQPIEKNGFPMMNVETPPQICSAPAPVSMYPINLSMSKNEPMDLSNDSKPMKLEPQAVVTIDSDEDDDGLRIVEETTPQVAIKKSPTTLEMFNNNAPNLPQINHQMNNLQEPSVECKMSFDEPAKNISELAFAMTSRIADLDKLEPLRDLPMEILNND